MDWVEFSISFIAICGNALLALLAWSRNSKSATNRLFALLGFSFALWGIATYLAVNSVNEVQALWWVRVAMMFAVPQAVFFMLLMYTFPRSVMKIPRRVFWLLMGVMVAMMILAISPYLFPAVSFTPGQEPQPHPGPAMAAFIPIAIGSVLLGFYFLIKKILKSQGVERVRALYLMLGAVIMFLLIIGLSFIGVAFYGEASFGRYGPVFTLPFVILTSYTILRYRLMDIKAAIWRAVGFSVLVGSFFIIYGLAGYKFMTGLRGLELSQVQYAIIGTIGTAFAVIGFNYYRSFLQGITDKFLHHGQVDYKKELVNLSQELASTIQINEVTDIVLKAMQNSVRSSKILIYLKDPTDGEFKKKASWKALDYMESMSKSDKLFSYMAEHMGPLIKDELQYLYENTISKTKRREIQSIVNTMDWLDLSAIVPLYVNKELAGVIMLGGKISGQPYLQEDTEFLAAFAPQAAVALENARLYAESLKFGKHLKKEVEKATKDLETANTQLRDLDKAKSEFLSIASHQLYTPLTALRGYISMLREGDFGKVGEKQAPILEILEKSSSRLIELIKNLLDISRIESGRFELNLQSIDLVNLSRDLVKDLMPNAIRKRLTLEFQEPTYELPHVVADEQRLRQVILNFIDNAIKYTNHGRVDVKVEQDGDELVFSVSDTGKGIARSEITKLFNKFSRVGNSARFNADGAGLGLYVAKQIVNEHRGDVYAESHGEGHGSKFIMRLPVQGSPRSLAPGEKAEVVIKAAEATEG